MANPITYSRNLTTTSQPGVDLRWPASALWRPDDVAVRKISFADVRDAIAEGIDDFRAMPTHAIFLCVVYPVVGFILYRLLSGYHLVPLIYPMAAGFALLGPVAAIGLYEMSRRRERGLDVTAADALEVFHSPSIGAILRLGIVVAAIFFAWLYTAQLIYTQIFGNDVPQSLSALWDQVTTSREGLQLIAAGNAVGLVFAIAVLAISTISFPMLVDRNVGATTAVRTSVRAAVENPLPFALWGLIVALSLVLGALPALVGLVVVLPVLGHATWHLYRKVVPAE